MTIFYCLSFETPQTWKARSPYLYYTRNRVAQLYPQALGSLFVASYDSQGYGGHSQINLTAVPFRCPVYRLKTDRVLNTAPNTSSTIVVSSRTFIIASAYVVAETFLQSRCLAMAGGLGCYNLAINVPSGSPIPAFSRYVTLVMKP
jgi:hypothetical protein